MLCFVCRIIKADNINLVTPTHFTIPIIKAIEKARNKGLRIPVVYNTSAYENVETLRMLDGIVDVYLPDFKLYGQQAFTAVFICC